MNYKEVLQNRIKKRKKRSLLDVNTKLQHFSLISYAVPLERIAKYIPEPFELWTFTTEDKKFALVSAVPFVDYDFHFYHLAKFPKFKFCQTNFRTYIVDKRNGEHAAWFFGTTLGSFSVYIPRLIWKMPWQYAKYKINTKFENNRYIDYEMSFKSSLGNGSVHIKDTGKALNLLPSFETLDEQMFILTHPVLGYYNRPKQGIGTYEIWHPKMKLTHCTVEHLYFELFEKLGLLSKDEMLKPHSVLITPEIEFDVLLPPRKMKTKI